MNESQKGSRLSATLSAVIAFALGTLLAEIALIMGNAGWEFAHQIVVEYPNARLEPYQPYLHILCVTVGVGCGVFVFRICRRTVSTSVVFHATFSAGFALLCYCLWLSLINFALVNRPLVDDWPANILQPLFSTLTCLLFMPTAVLLLAYAVARDQNRHP